MEICVGNTLIMKKKHPCGSNKWLVLRTGMDIKMQCCGCGREIMCERHKIEKNIKMILSEEVNK